MVEEEEENDGRGRRGRVKKRMESWENKVERKKRRVEGRGGRRKERKRK